MDKQIDLNKKLEEAFDSCVKLIESGATVDYCLSLYPEHSSELKELLYTAASVVQAYSEVKPSSLYLEAGKKQFLDAIDSIKQEEAVLESRSVIAISHKKLYKMVAIAAAAAIVFSAGLVKASSNSLPGSPLYGVKRAAENVQLALTFDKASKAKLHYELAKKRLAEARILQEKADKKTDKEEVAVVYQEAEENLGIAEDLAKSADNDEKKSKTNEELEKLSKKINDQAKKFALDVNLEGKIDINRSAKNNNKNSDNDNAVTKKEKVAVVVGSDKEANANRQANQKQTADNNGEASILNPSDKNQSQDVKNDKEKRLIANKRRFSSDNEMTSDRDNFTLSNKSTASLVPFEVEEIFVTEEFFSPNGDGIKDKTTIYVSGATADGYSIIIYSGATKIATLIEKASSKESRVTWDGKDDSNQKISDGEYLVKVLGADGQIAHKNAKVVVDTRSPRVEIVGPPSGISTINAKPQFVWKDNEDVANYRLFIMPEKDVADDSKRIISDITNTFYELTKELSPGLWSWRVIAIDKAGNIGISSKADLTIENSAQAIEENKIE